MLPQRVLQLSYASGRRANRQYSTDVLYKHQSANQSLNLAYKMWCKWWKVMCCINANTETRSVAV